MITLEEYLEAKKVVEQYEEEWIQEQEEVKNILSSPSDNKEMEKRLKQEILLKQGL